MTIELDSQEFKDAIKEYLHNNLTIRVDVGHDYSYHGRRVEVELWLGGERIDSASDSLPECRCD